MNKNNLEIERKWLVNGFPNGKVKLLYCQEMRQGYISIDPTVRIRSEFMVTSPLKDTNLNNEYILCFKSSSTDGLSRKEIEYSIDKDKFFELEKFINLPLINKTRNTYLLSDGHHLEVNHVDEGLDSEFWYAEIEFDSKDEAINFKPASVGLDIYLEDEVTNNPNESMAAYWYRTRIKSL